MSKTILLADDSKTIQQAVNFTFRLTEFEVVTAKDGEEALQRIVDSKPAVVLADITMPKKNGYQLCTAIKNDERTARIPVILLAGPFDPVDEAQAKTAKADGHLAKPFETHALIERIKAITSPEALATRARPAAPTPEPAPAASPPAKPPEAEESLAQAAPTLEPPPAPGAWAQAKTEVREVDVWSLQDQGGAKAPESKPVTKPVAAVASAMADAAAEPIAELAQSQTSGLSKDELVRLARDVIERIAWDVVPDLAESLIKAELKRLLSEPKSGA